MNDLDLNSKDDLKRLFKHRLRKILLDANITTLNELTRLSVNDLGKIKGVGWVTQVNIEGILSDNGLQLFNKPSDAMVQAAFKVASEEGLIKRDADLIGSAQSYSIVQKMIQAALIVKE